MSSNNDDPRVMVIDEKSPSDIVSIVESDKPLDPNESQVHLISVQNVGLPPAEAKDQKDCESPRAGPRRPPFQAKSPVKVSRGDLKYKPSPKNAQVVDASLDALSVNNASVALSAMTGIQVRDRYTIPRSELCTEQGNSVMTPPEGPDYESIAVSAMTIKKPMMVDRGHSVRSPSEKSVRDKEEGVSAGRFEAHQFDARVQTERELMELYFAKETTDKEVATTPRHLKEIQEKRSI